MNHALDKQASLRADEHATAAAASKKVGGASSKTSAAAKKKPVAVSAGKSSTKAKSSTKTTTAKAPAAKVAPKSAGKTAVKKAAPSKPASKSAAAAPKKPVAKAAALSKPAAKGATKHSPSKPAGKSPAKPASKSNVLADAKSKAAHAGSTGVATKSAVKPAVKAAGATPQKGAAMAVGQKVPVPAAVSTAPVKSTAVVATKPPTAPAKSQTARASAKSPVHMPLPDLPLPSAQVSRFADRFAPSKPSQGRVVVDATPEAQRLARKDPKLVNAWKSKAGREMSEDEVLAMPDDQYMNDHQLEFFKRRLSDLKSDLLSNAGETTEHLREDTSIVPDPADRATIEEEHALELRTRDRERKLLKKISQSLARIDAGDYGYCDETGEPIGVARLLARPTATLSLEAQQRRELKQKMFGD